MSDIGILNALKELVNRHKEHDKNLRRIVREMTLLREAIQRMAPPPRELDIPDLETYCEMLEEGEDERA